jgi:hypothetical protein
LRQVDSVDELKKEYLDCRDRGHAWFDPRKKADSLQRTGHGAVWRKLVCQRCTTVRADYITRRTGVVEMRRYFYPDGYQIKAGSGVAKNEIRKLAVKAAFATLRKVS